MQRRMGFLTAVVAVLLAAAGSVGTGTPAAAAVHTAAATGSISGTVTVPAGVDVHHVGVHAYRLSSPSGDAGSTLAAADGSYVLGGLEPGQYIVSFDDWIDGLVEFGWPGNGYGTVSWYAGGQASPVTVGTGEVSGIDATLMRGATLSGTVRTNSDCDLSWLRVTVTSASPRATVTVPAVLDPDGTWTIIGLPTLQYTLDFDGPSAGLTDSASLTGSVTAGQTVGGLQVTMNGPAVGCVAPTPYVIQVYRDLLGRVPDPAGQAVWEGELEAGTPYGEVANAITGSDEYRSRLIRESYTRYLGRGAEPAGLAYWLSRMHAGVHIEDMQAGFIASDEFYARGGGTDAGWVALLYRTVLGRTPAPSEVAWWVGAIGSGMNRGSVALGFLYSTEHLTTVVDGYYVDLLGRHIDPSGKASWVGLIQHGHRDEEIIAGIVASTEYRSKVVFIGP